MTATIDSFAGYEAEALLTVPAPEDPQHQTLLAMVWGLGLSSEAGEVAGELNRFGRGDDGDCDAIPPDRREAILDQLGDVLWSLTALASTLGSDLQDIACRNVLKRASRLRRGVLLGSGGRR